MLRPRIVDLLVALAITAVALATVPRGGLFPIHLAWWGLACAAGLAVPSRARELARIESTLLWAAAVFSIPLARAIGWVEWEPSTNAEEFAHLLACTPAAVVAGIMLRDRLRRSGDETAAMRAVACVLAGASIAAAAFFWARWAGFQPTAWFCFASVVAVAATEFWRGEASPALNDEPPSNSARSFCVILGVLAVATLLGFQWGRTLHLAFAKHAETTSRDPARISRLGLTAAISVAALLHLRPRLRPANAMLLWPCATWVALSGLDWIGQWIETPLPRGAPALVEHAALSVASVFSVLAAVRIRAPGLAPAHRLAIVLCGATIGHFLVQYWRNSDVIPVNDGSAMLSLLGIGGALSISDWWITPAWRLLLVAEVGLAAACVWFVSQY